MKSQQAIPVTVAGLAGAWCVALWLARRIFAGSAHYSYLNYNLALAFVPLLLSTALVAWPTMGRWRSLGLGMVWLAFFPNAPYLLTDLIHLRPRPETAPFWFDWLLLLSFAGAGWLIGCVSLAQVHRRLRETLSAWRAGMAVSGLLALTAFGIFLGRFPRWNSWDIVTRPGEFFAQVIELLIHPHDHPKMLAYTFGVTVMLGLAYFGPLAVHRALGTSRSEI